MKRFDSEEKEKKTTSCVRISCDYGHTLTCYIYISSTDQNNKLTTRVLLKKLVLCLEICNKKKTAFKSLKLVLTDILCCWVYLLMLERRSVHCIEALPHCSYHISCAFGIPFLSRTPQTSKGPDLLLAFCSLLDEGNHSVTWRFISCK